jgi:hypothetical protein
MTLCAELGKLHTKPKQAYEEARTNIPTLRKIFKMLAAVPQAPGLGLKGLGRCASVMELTLEINSILGHLDAYNAEREREKAPPIMQASPDSAMQLWLQQLSPANRVTVADVNAAQELTKGDTIVADNASAAAIGGLQAVLRHGGSNVAESVGNRVKVIGRSICHKMPTKLLLKLVAGDVPDEIDEFVSMLFTLLDYPLPVPEMLDDVQALWKALAKTGLCQFNTMSISDAMRERLDGNVDKGVKSENFDTLFSSVVAVHLLECLQEFTNCAATAKPYRAPTTLKPKAASNLETFVLQFNARAMALRAKDREHLAEVVAEMESMKRRFDGGGGAGKRKADQAWGGEPTLPWRAPRGRPSRAGRHARNPGCRALHRLFRRARGAKAAKEARAARVAKAAESIKPVATSLEARALGERAALPARGGRGWQQPVNTVTPNERGKRQTETAQARSQGREKMGRLRPDRKD